MLDDDVDVRDGANTLVVSRVGRSCFFRVATSVSYIWALLCSLFRSARDRPGALSCFTSASIESSRTATAMTMSLCRVCNETRSLELCFPHKVAKIGSSSVFNCCNVHNESLGETCLAYAKRIANQRREAG